MSYLDEVKELIEMYDDDIEFNDSYENVENREQLVQGHLEEFNKTAADDSKDESDDSDDLLNLYNKVSPGFNL